MDPKFAEAIRRARLEGEEMRKREYLESCDRGAKEIMEFLDNEYHQKQALESAHKGYKKHCTPASSSIYNCLTNKDHRECNDAKKKVYLEEGWWFGRHHMICYNLPK